MRAYLRLDPNFADRKADYPDGALAAFVLILCYAEQQPHRGRFRNERLLRVFLEKRARWLSFLVEKGDLSRLEDGRMYVEGWDEWQEGDWKVSERVARIRSRKTVTPTVTDGTLNTVTSTVSTPSERLAVGGKRLAEAVGGAPLPNGDASTFMGFKPKAGAHEGQHPDCLVCAPLRKAS